MYENTISNKLDLPDNSSQALYICDSSTVRALANEINAGGTFGGLFDSGEKYLISARNYPMDIETLFDPSDLLPSHGVKLGSQTMTTSATKIRPPAAWKLNKYIYGGQVLIPAADFEDFTRYPPYASAQIFIPYCGFVTMNLQDIIGKVVYLKYSIDWDNGQCTAFLTVSEFGDPENDFLIMQTVGNMGVDIPYITKNTAQKERNNLLTGLGVAAGTITLIASGGATAPIVAGAGLIASSAGSMITGNQTAITARGSFGGSAAGYLSPQNAFIIIERPIKLEPENYKHYYGGQCFKYVNLGTCEGFTQVHEIHLENMTSIFEDERREIEELLKTGVIF